jgi:tetratricopeptide (TPR) repeat protein
MRFIFLISLILFCFPLSSNPLLEKAEKAYDSKHYKEAIEAYEKLVKEGFRSYQLYFNLGNSYYRNNELGKAIYYYELARKLDPDDEDVKINLAIASSKTIDKIDAKENFFITAVKTNLLSSFSTAAWGWCSIIFIFLASVFFFIFVNSVRVSFKRMSFALSGIFFIGFIIIYSLGYSAVRATKENKFAIITAHETRIMNEPTRSATGKFSLHEGTRVKVIENNGDWLLIRLDNGNEGWVRSADVGVI